VFARVGGQQLVGAAQRVEEVELALAGKQLVVPLDMEQGRRRYALSVSLEAAGDVDVGIEARGCL
jgi:hypothetical protein